MPLIKYYLGRPAHVYINAMSRKKSKPQENSEPLPPVSSEAGGKENAWEANSMTEKEEIIESELAS
jgi:hypothetical protein